MQYHLYGKTLPKISYILLYSHHLSPTWSRHTCPVFARPRFRIIHTSVRGENSTFDFPIYFIEIKLLAKSTFVSLISLPSSSLKCISLEFVKFNIIAEGLSPTHKFNPPLGKYYLKETLQIDSMEKNKLRKTL